MTLDERLSIAAKAACESKEFDCVHRDEGKFGFGAGRCGSCDGVARAVLTAIGLDVPPPSDDA